MAYPYKRERKLSAATITYSKLQLALLRLMLRKSGPVTLDEIEVNVYRSVKKNRPQNSRQAVAALVRSTGHKIAGIGGNIERQSTLGRGNAAHYLLSDKKGNVKMTVERMR